MVWLCWCHHSVIGGNASFASCVVPCYQNDQLVREIKVVARHETVNAEFVIMMCEISEISDAGSICQISAHCTTPAHSRRAEIQISRVYLKMKSSHSSCCCCLISSDLLRSSPVLSLSSPNTSTSSLITSLHPALSISASRLNLCF